jgi:probable HAF family extracellular repeat protein
MFSLQFPEIRKRQKPRRAIMKTPAGKIGSLFALLLLCGLGAASPSYGQGGQYTLYELGTLGGPNTYAYDINDSGRIVGVGDTPLYDEGTVWQAFTGTKDGISAVFPEETVRSSANAINRDGVIAGYKNGRAFLVGGGSPFVDLGVLPGAGASWGLGLNRGKKVVGYSWNPGVSEKGALWEQDGSGNYLQNDIGTLGGAYTRATSVNDTDQVAGHSQNATGANRAFRWQKVAGNATLAELGVLTGFTDSFALRINNRGAVAGYNVVMDEFYNQTARACLWGDNGVQELKKKNASGLSESVLYSEAYGINDSGSVVGMYYSEEHQELRAFLWDAANEMRDLNSLLPANSGLLLVAAYAINNKGEIVGYGYKGTSTHATAFLLVPPSAPEPPDPIVEPFEVDIDFRPWSSNNKINLHARWSLIPIAILSGADFNAPADVDRRSLTFGRTGDEESLAFCMPWKYDVNHDRKKDLVCYFYERSMGFQCGDTVGTLKGKTREGEEFGGQDQVKIVPCPPPGKHHGRK